MKTRDLIPHIKRSVDLHDLAERLGLQRPGGRGNYRSPHHNDSTPSLQIKTDYFCDYSTSGDDARGDAIDLVRYVQGGELEDALDWLCREYGFTWTRGQQRDPSIPRAWPEVLADRVLANPEPAVAYLVEQRKIPEATVRAAIRAKTVGYNDWTNPKPDAGPGSIGHGGPAAAFVVRSFNPGHALAVDLRYFDAALNGGVKTNTQGQKEGAPWTSDVRKLKKARELYVVESAINALSIDACNLPGVAAVAIRGNARVVDLIDWRFAAGKQVFIACDNDAPNDKGECPGMTAAWAIHERLLAQDIAAQVVDQSTWDEFNYNDLNDILQSEGPDQLGHYLRRIEPWLIPGQPGKDGKGRTRVYLPSHDFAQYWRFRAQRDYMQYVSKVDRDEHGDEELKFKDLAGFRLAGISRVAVASYTSVMTGETDNAPQVYFAASVQVPRHGPELQRRVLDDDKLHNVDQWKKFGPVFDQSAFLRLVSIMERATHIGSREAINIVGLGWRRGQLIVNEGPDCYFIDPDLQCRYSKLRFPSGSPGDARSVLEAYGKTFAHNAASIALVWSLGGHLKPILGFWPHCVMQADKGAGKSTLIKRLERTISFEMLSGQAMRTAFRLVTSVSGTTHPIGWEELSTQRTETIKEAVDLLQETYNYTISPRGTRSGYINFLQCAPVLLAGEDVPADGLLSKLIRTNLTDRQGELIPEALPQFPVRQWLAHIAEVGAAHVREVYDQAREHCARHNRAGQRDRGAARIAENYAAILACWYLLADWLGWPRDKGLSLRMDGALSPFADDLAEEMNRHIAETGSTRQPWVWIIETVLNEISAGEYKFPHKVTRREIDGEPELCLVLRLSHVMAHCATRSNLREKYNSFPIKSDRVLRRQLDAAKVIREDRVDLTIGRKKESHLVALGVADLERWGLYVSVPEDTGDEGLY